MIRTLPRLCAAFALGLVLAPVVSAFQKPEALELPNFDKRRDAAAAAPAPVPAQKAAALQRLRERLPGAQVEFEPITGAPKTLRARDGFLSGPESLGRAVPAGAAAAIPATDRHRPVKAFLEAHRELFGHGAEALERARVQRDYVTPHNGMKTIVWAQELDGIPIYEAVFVAHATKRDELISVSSQFVADPDQAANAGARQPGRRSAPDLTAKEAVIKATQSLGVPGTPESVTARDAVPTGPVQRQRYEAGAFVQEIESQLVWLPLKPGLLRLCWQVELTRRVRGERFRVLVDAQSGEVLLRHCLTVYVSKTVYSVYTSDSPSPFSPGHFGPLTNQPPVMPRAHVTLAALNTNASPNGWIDDGVNETRGNNVDAHTDRNADNQPDLPRPQGSPVRVFDFPMDLTQPPTNYSPAAVVQLFYWCNWMHDRLYEVGFTEAAGNFQSTNFGRGGLGNDALQADAQDGSGFNNANMSTPSDGSPPRMQMFLFNGPTPDRDGDLDAEIVLHEYTHGLSGRLVGGGVGISTLQSAGMGEGWSDWYALTLLSEPDDDLGGCYASGGYATYQLSGLLTNYYFGIRRYPYSTNLAKNPLTFKDIDPTQASDHAGIPRSPIIGNTAAEVHNQGEVWCAILWEVRINLIAKHGYAVGNHLALQLVTDGMKLSPPNPDFVQARDAIVLADQVLTGGSNQSELWAGFAKRGLGSSASAPDSSTTTGVVEAFDLPDDLRISPVTGFTASGPLGGPFQPASQTLTLSNAGNSSLSWSVVNTSLWLSVVPLDGNLAPGSPAASVTVTLNATANSLPAGVYSDTIQLSNHTSGRVQGRDYTAGVGQPDYFTELFSGMDTNDLAFRMFTFTPDGSGSYYGACQQPISTFPTTPDGGTPVALGDDSFTKVTLSDSATVSLYGKRTNAFFIGSNGYLTFDEGDTSMSETFDSHFLLPRVSALFDDLDPGAGGTISWRQLADRVAVTYQSVPEWGNSSRTNSFQIELFFDGRIRLTYLNVSITDGLAGLSAGNGVPTAFAESDFQGFEACAAARLVVSVPATASEGTGMLIGQGVVQLPAPSAVSVRATLASSDRSEVLVSSSVLIPAGQTNATFNLTILDDADLDGTQIAVVTAAAPNYGEGRATIRVIDNETAVLSLALPASVREGKGVTQGTVRLSAAPPVNVLVNLASSDPNELQVPAVTLIPAGQTSAVVNLLPVDDTRIDGPQTATVTARVENWTEGIASLTVLDNETLDLAVTLPSLALESDGTLTNAGAVRLAGTLPTNLVVSLASSDQAAVTVLPSVTIPAGQFSAPFDLKLVDDAAVGGSRSVTITASAAGFAQGTGTLTVADDEIPLAPFGPQPSHRTMDVGADTDLAWRYPQGNAIINGSFETGDFTGWMKTTVGNGDYSINDGTFEPQSPDGPLPPYAGRFSAISDESGPSVHTLFQDVMVPLGGPPRLQWAHRVRNHAGVFTAGQSFRVEIRNTDDALLALAFSTQPGDTALQDWTLHKFDLTPFQGQLVRIAFIDQSSTYYFNAHVDEVAILGAPVGGSIISEVYFGTNSTPGPAELLGTTTNTLWNLPRLEPDTTYYWQIVARRTGVTPGPIWQFTTRGVDHLEWSAVPSPQVWKQPFGVAITARDEFGRTVPSFTGPVQLTTLTQPPGTALFGESFEDGDFAGWTIGSGSYQRMVTSNTAAGGTFSFTQIGGSQTHFDGVTRSLDPEQPDRVIFHVRAATANLACGYVVLGQGMALADWVAFFFMMEDGRMGLYEESAGAHAIPYQANRWYKVSLFLDWTARRIDYYVDDALVEAGIPFRGEDVTSLSRIDLYNFHNTQAWWDQIDLARGGRPLTLSLAPTNSGAFANGVWSGSLTISEPAEDVELRATDEQGHRGTSNPLSVVAFDDLGVKIAAAPDPVGVNETLTYTLTVTNTGPSLATGVYLTNELPASITLVSLQPSQGSCVNLGGLLACELGSLPGGAQATVTIVVIPTTPTVLTNRVAVGRAEPDPYALNNVAVVETVVMPPTLRISDTTVAEGNSDTTAAVFTVRLDSPRSDTVTVSFATTNGTAQASLDFLSTTGVLTFAPGVTTQRVTVAVVGDLRPEADETFAVVLSNPTNAALASAQGTGTILNDDVLACASLPMVEDWESGSFGSRWLVTGTGAFRSEVTNAWGAHRDIYHLVMDRSDVGLTPARNEVTFCVDLNGYTNVLLHFWALNIGDEPHGPPPSPFTGGADFDGVAISADGATWYEVQDLRHLSDSYTEFLVDLDAAAAAYGLHFNSNFRIRFNEYDDATTLYDVDGIAIDDIAITGRRIGINAHTARLLSETCIPPNGEIDPGETVTVELALVSVGQPATENLLATLLETDGVLAPSGPQSYGVLIPGGLPVTNVFTFTALGPCGGTMGATLQLKDGLQDLGTAEFVLGLGVQRTNVLTFVQPTGIGIDPSTDLGLPYPSSNVVSGVTGTVRKVTVTLSNVTYSVPDALNVLLVGPGGQSAILASDVGGYNDLTNVTITLDDDAPAPLPDSGLVVPGVWKPTNVGTETWPRPAPSGSYVTNLAVFRGVNPNGAWRLFAYDDSGTTGAISGGWHLTFSLPESNCCLNASASDLAVGYLTGPTNLAFGPQISHSISVRCRGPAPATGVIVSNPLPPGVSFVSATSPLASCTNVDGVVMCNFGTLATNTTTGFVLRMQPLTTGLVTNTTWISGAELDPNPLNNVVTRVTTVTPPLVSIGNLTVSEGDAGLTVATFTARLADAYFDPISLQFATADGSALAGEDYLETNGLVVFAPGETSKTIAVSIVGDQLDENNETFYLLLSHLTNATVFSSRVVGTISDDDPVPQLSINDVSVPEGDSGGNPARFTVTLTPASGQQVTVSYATASGSAQAPDDFLATNGVLVFAPGESTKTVVVPVMGDTLNETNETFVVNLTSPLNATLAKPQGHGTILSDDPLPYIVLSDARLVAGSCASTNQWIDPGETVTVALTLRNASPGVARTTNLVVTLLAQDGVSGPSGPQTYGALLPGGPSETRSFTFTANRNCGDSLITWLQLQDGPTLVGVLSNTWNVGLPVLALSEGFDVVMPPALPGGWTTLATGSGLPWITTTNARQTLPNAAFAPGLSVAGDMILRSPPVSVISTSAQVSFQHSYVTEACCDGGWLEIAINGGTFTNIVAAGGTFVAHGYTGFADGEPAWSGDSGGFVQTVATLPTSVAGQTIQLQWRLSTDSSFGATGWHVDAIALSGAFDCCGALPRPVIRSVRHADGLVTITWTSVAAQSYRLQYKTALDDTDWLELPGDVLATGDTASKTDIPAPAIQRFYRVTLRP